MNTGYNGIYQHYKGGIYEVMGVGKHSETLEDFVVYKALYTHPTFGDSAIWIRPKVMFFSEVDYRGNKIPRFFKIDA